MRQMPVEPPTEHYDEKIADIDEQICKLIKQRKDLSNHNPGFPTAQWISAWSEKYDFCEEFLTSVFLHFFNEDIYRPVVEPKGFRKNIPVLKSFEKDDLFFSVTLVRQFENASVVHFSIDANTASEPSIPFQEHPFFDLSIEGGGEYECRNEGGGGCEGHMFHTYTISPALPDDLSVIKFVFKECKEPFQQPAGFEFVI